jgi:2-aminoadipate transaminase
VTFVPGADFFPAGRGGRSSARLAFSFASPDEIREGIARLAALVPHAAAV